MSGWTDGESLIAFQAHNTGYIMTENINYSFKMNIT